MKRQTVESTNIRSVGYDAGNELLEIEFHGGATYEYYAVPSRTHTGLMEAHSKGKYFLSNVRNIFKFKKIR